MVQRVPVFWARKPFVGEVWDQLASTAVIHNVTFRYEGDHVKQWEQLRPRDVLLFRVYAVTCVNYLYLMVNS